jgi:hypothetical protein
MKFLCRLQTVAKCGTRAPRLRWADYRTAYTDQGPHFITTERVRNSKAAILENARLRSVHDQHGNRSRSDDLVSNIANEQSI